MRRVLALAGIVSSCPAHYLAGQSPPAPPPTPLLQRLVGQWTMTGTVRTRPVTYRLEGAWVVQGRFLELHMHDVANTPPKYEARVFIGPDTLPGRVLAHWLDNFGAVYSVPPATGRLAGNSLTLDFPYPDGAFHDTFVYDSWSDTWTIHLDAADGAGGWKRFAEYRAARHRGASQ
jgi:hypothetical protein